MGIKKPGRDGPKNRSSGPWSFGPWKRVKKGPVVYGKTTGPFQKTTGRLIENNRTFWAKRQDV